MRILPAVFLDGLIKSLSCNDSPIVRLKTVNKLYLSNLRKTTGLFNKM